MIPDVENPSVKEKEHSEDWLRGTYAAPNIRQRNPGVKKRKKARRGSNVTILSPEGKDAPNDQLSSPAMTGDELHHLIKLEDTEVGNYKKILNLIKAGADIDKPDERGFTPLMLACSKGHEDIVSLLLNNHADVNKTTKEGFSALNNPTTILYPEIVKILLEARANIYQQTNLGWNAFMYATVLSEPEPSVSDEDGSITTPLVSESFLTLYSYYSELAPTLRNKSGYTAPLLSLLPGVNSTVIRWWLECETSICPAGLPTNGAHQLRQVLELIDCLEAVYHETLKDIATLTTSAIFLPIAPLVSFFMPKKSTLTKEEKQGKTLEEKTEYVKYLLKETHSLLEYHDDNKQGFYEILFHILMKSQFLRAFLILDLSGTDGSDIFIEFRTKFWQLFSSWCEEATSGQLYTLLNHAHILEKNKYHHNIDNKDT